MPCSCGDFASAAGQQFDVKTAAKQLKDYRRGKIAPTTRLLRDGVVTVRLNAGTLLDVGAGIGALTFELLERGVATAVAVDASSAYLQAVKEEATSRRQAESLTCLHGDFVALARETPVADVVTLDRVVCCYADYTSLLNEAVRHARRGIALSYPRDRWFVRLGVRIENALRQVRSTAFRTFVHPVEDIHRLIGDGGFELTTRSETAAWAVDIYVRRPEGAGL
ncbi:MAG: class I SAM-dependent methyltransferase [Vicinamibacterales bacterium]